MESSFANADQAADIVPTEIVPVQLGDAPIVTEDFFTNEGLEGDNIGQTQIPWIFLVHGVGDLSAKFAPGSLVLNAELLLKQPLEITVVHQKMFMLEDIPFNSPERGVRRPNKFATLDLARAAGYLPKWETYDMETDGVKAVVNCADMDILVKGSATEENYPLDYSGTPYLFARMRAKGGDFKLTAEKVKSIANFNRGKPLCTFKWVLTTNRLKIGANWVWRLNFASSGKNTPEFIEFARQLLP
jgi:hypothetical protein